MRRQQRQIRAATGRDVSTLELRLVPLPEPAVLPTDDKQGQ
jgi:hypothetical protein